jgi:GT2 family glycosyltransferase
MSKRKTVNQVKSTYDLDIVIPVFGQAGLLKSCLQSIQETCVGVNYNVILIDDNSPDDELLKELYKTNKVIRNKQTRGFPYNCNAGALLGNAKYILFLNSDIVLLPNCIQEMIKTLEDKDIALTPHTPQDNKGVGVVGAKLLFPETSASAHKPAGKVQHAGLCFPLSASPKHRLIGWEANHPKVNVQRELQAVSGACLLIKREVWNKIYEAHRQIGDPSQGGFNEIYGRGTYEDVELCLATRSFGYRVIYEPKAVAYHYTNASSEKTGGFPTNKNQAIFSARCGHLLAYDEWLLL